MKRFLHIFGASFLGICGSLVAQDSMQTTELQKVEMQNAPAGRTFVQSVREEFQAGTHKSFLEDAEKKYQKNKKAHTYDSFLETRRETSKLTSIMKGVAKPDTLKDFEKKSNDLLAQRNRQLSQIIISHDSEDLAQSLKNSVFFTFSEDQKDALDYFFDLHTKFKGEGNTPLENELIAVDIEYWLKQRDLDTAHIQKKISHEDFEKYALVLEFAKLEAMKNAALKEPDSKLSHAIFVAHATYPTQASIVYDQKFLSKLADDKILARTPLEKKLQDVMKKYVTQRSELTAEYYPEQK